MGSLFGGAAVGRLLPAVVVVLLASLPHRVGAANILVLSPYTCRSHTNFVSNIVRALAQRGHALTYWNGLEPRDDLPDNVRQLFSDGMRAMNTNHEVSLHHHHPTPPPSRDRISRRKKIQREIRSRPTKVKDLVPFCVSATRFNWSDGFATAEPKKTRARSD